MMTPEQHQRITDLIDFTLYIAALLVCIATLVIDRMG